MNRLRAHTGPLWPYLVLVAIPAAAFVLPDLFGGHLLITGDNLQQNYPLHVLVGSMFRNGQLPFWNQYIFSGTPLMGDFNAGAFYPLMGLFVILPDRAAWIATEVILFSAIAIGMYVFLRALTLSTMACLLGAATFAFSGTVLSQVNHVDMTEGFVAIPWMLLSVLHIVRDGRWRWSILLGISFATVILAGAPEAMLDEALLVIAFAALSAGFDRGRWWHVLTRCAAGAGLALSLAAIQWLPGLNAISNSQRAGGGAGFAASGSYPTQFSILSLVPYLNGGYGHLGEALFFSQYNLPEVEIYFGILPLIALITLLHPRWPSRIPPHDRLTWYGVGLIGFLLALGANTPLEHLFNQLPLYGHQRLQSRNMITVAVAICVLFAGWIDRRDSTQPDEAMVRYDRVMALVPFGLVAALAIWALASPSSLLRVFAGARASASTVGTVREATVIALAFCAGAAAVVWLRPRLSRIHWVRLVAVFVAIDIGIVAATSQLASWPTNDIVAGTTPTQQLMAAHLPADGRMINYDPQLYATAPGTPQGIPDLNIIPRLPSVAGYASIVNGNYESVTQTHAQGELNVGGLAAGALDRLDLQEVVTLPEYFLVPLESLPPTIDGISQISEGFSADPVLPRGYGANFDDQRYPFYPGPRPALRSGESASWFFGESLAPQTGTLLFTQPAQAAALVRFGIVQVDGTTRWSASVPVRPGAVRVSARLPRRNGVAMVVNALGSIPAQKAIVTVNGSPFELGGSLSSALIPGTWQQVGMAQGYTVYTRLKPPTPISAAVIGSGRDLRVQVISSTTKSEEVRVDAPGPSVVTRSVAWDAGWTGSVSVNGAKALNASVESVNLVQAIRIPAGDDVVTFHYRPPHLLVSSVLSLTALGLLVVLAGAWILRRRGGRSEVVVTEHGTATRSAVGVS